MVVALGQTEINNHNHDRGECLIKAGGRIVFHYSNSESVKGSMLQLVVISLTLLSILEPVKLQEDEGE